MKDNIKIEWDSKKEVFWVRVGHRSSRDRLENRSSRQITRQLGELGIMDWSWSMKAKRAVGKGK